MNLVRGGNKNDEDKKLQGRGLKPKLTHGPHETQKNFSRAAFKRKEKNIS